MMTKNNKKQIVPEKVEKEKTLKKVTQGKVMADKKRSSNLPKRTEDFCRKYTLVILHLVPFILLIQDMVIYVFWKMNGA